MSKLNLTVQPQAKSSQRDYTLQSCMTKIQLRQFRKSWVRNLIVNLLMQAILMGPGQDRLYYLGPDKTSRTQCTPCVGGGAGNINPQASRLVWWPRCHDADIKVLLERQNISYSGHTSRIQTQSKRKMLTSEPRKTAKGTCGACKTIGSVIKMKRLQGVLLQTTPMSSLHVPKMPSTAANLLGGILTMFSTERTLVN